MTKVIQMAEIVADRVNKIVGKAFLLMFAKGFSPRVIRTKDCVSNA